jgi:capsular exopolysaccharide synthesis family protein
MSRIFDALQQSAAEHSGTEFQPPLPPTELLELTERSKANACATSLVQEESITQNEPILPDLQPVLLPTAAVQSATERPLNVAPVAKDAGVDPFKQFQSLPTLAPPQSRVVCVTDTGSLAAEKFRFIGVRIRQLRQKRSLKKLLITSTIPQEGKSMVAANLACTLARRKPEKVLLLDGDLRRPSLASLFGLGAAPGICEWLQGEASPSTSIFYLENAGLWIMPAGNTPGNPLELMQGSRFTVLLEQLSNWFDWIVIDSPPVLPLADTSIWMRLADGILLVARQGTTEKKQLQRGLEAIEPAKLVGALLNCSASTAHSDYYYHYRSPAAAQATDQPAKQAS